MRLAAITPNAICIDARKISVIGASKAKANGRAKGILINEKQTIRPI